jgi:hypothetical protein
MRSSYVAHVPFTLPSGSTFQRGDVLKGLDAIEFERAVRDGNTDVNNATPGASDPEA